MSDSEKQIVLAVKFDGETLSLSLPFDCSLLDLKNHLAELTNVPVHAQRLAGLKKQKQKQKTRSPERAGTSGQTPSPHSTTDDSTPLFQLLPRRGPSKRAYKLMLVGTSLVEGEAFDEAILEEKSAAVVRELEYAERMAAERERLRRFAEEQERERQEREAELQRRVEERRRRHWIEEQRRAEMDSSSELTLLLPCRAADEHVSEHDGEQMENTRTIMLPSSALERIVSSKVCLPVMFRLERIGSLSAAENNTSEDDHSPSEMIKEDVAVAAAPSSSSSSSSCTPETATVTTTPTTVHCFVGVRGFSAPPHCVLLPSVIRQQLSLRDGDPVRLHTVKLPKATLLRLWPRHERWNLLDTSVQKVLLEQHLRLVPCLAKGDVVRVHYQRELFQFDVDSVEPQESGGVDLMNTDVSLELVSSTALPLQQQDDVPSMTGESTPTASDTTNSGHTLGSVAAEVDTEECPSCRRQVPSRSLALHQVRCARLHWFCDRCEQSVRVSERETHERTAHSLILCECGVEVEQFRLATHKQCCVLRTEQCQFCQLGFAFQDLSVHQKSCGSRTTECAHCHQRTLRAKIYDHLFEAHGMPSELINEADFVYC